MLLAVGIAQTMNAGAQNLTPQRCHASSFLETAAVSDLNNCMAVSPYAEMLQLPVFSYEDMPNRACLALEALAGQN